jgi:surfeit locus 1 family protein
MRLKARRIAVLAAAVLAAAGTARLGVWQLDRAAQKVSSQQRLNQRRAMPPLLAAQLARDPMQAESQFDRGVTLQGRWLVLQTVYLDNRPMSGRTGFLAVTPLQLGDGSAVLVQRGWVARDMLDRTRIELPPLPAGQVTIHGHIAPTLSRLYEFDAAASGPIRQNLDVREFAAETGLSLRPFAIVQDDSADGPADGLLRQWARPDNGLQRHYGYAFQWFALCALVVGLYAWFQLIRPFRIRHGRG